MVREAVIQALGGPDVPVLSSPIEDYLKALSDAVATPGEAVAVCTLRADEAAPAILAVLAKAGDGAKLNDGEVNLLFRGLHILGGARDPAVWPVLLRLLRRPSDDVELLLGDAITETLPKILAGVFDGDTESVFDLIADDSVDEFVRDAMIGAAAFLTWDGRIERTRMRDFLVSFYEKRLVEEGGMLWIGWLEAIGLLGLRELAPLAYQTWDEGRIPEGFLERGNFEAYLRSAEQAPDDIERFQSGNLGYIEDVLASLGWVRGDDDGDVDEDTDYFRTVMEAPPDPIRNPMRGVGRNDPCPCGSGKKAKKCCLAAG